MSSFRLLVCPLGLSVLLISWSLVLFGTAFQSFAADGNRLSYVDAPCDPFYPHGNFPRLVTPQWIGEEGVDAVIVLSIDDLRDTTRYENFLRPIFERLKAIDGRAPVSIFTVKIDPKDPLIQRWLAEGVSLEVHTVTHPCPLLQEGDFSAAKKSYEDCVDLLATVPGLTPRAVRIPCCDSMNSPSPRFFAEIFAARSAQGRFLWMDSSIPVVFTKADADLPEHLVVDESGQDRFAKYIPAERELGSYVEDYPYPYVVGKLCWEIPPVMPSDWNAQRVNGTCHPHTLRDWQRAVDAVVIKKGIWALCFHPHGWIAAEQIVALVDYVAQKYGPRVKFLTFPEVLLRLETHLLAGQSLRAADGSDNGIRILDVNGDGWMDVVIANKHMQVTRVWTPETGWKEYSFPAVIATRKGFAEDSAHVYFGVLGDGKEAYMLLNRGRKWSLWQWTPTGWREVPDGLKGAEELEVLTAQLPGEDIGVRLRDIDGDGSCELLVGNSRGNVIYTWRAGTAAGSSPAEAAGPSPYLAGSWHKLSFTLPWPVVSAQGKDLGLRLVDLDGDRDLDVVASGPTGWLVAKFEDLANGWVVVRQGKRSEPGALAPFVDETGANLGAWFKYGRLWIQNEYTGRWVGEGPGRYRIAADWITFGELLSGSSRPRPADQQEGASTQGGG